MPHEEDFAVDVDGLRDALDRLVAARQLRGSAHVDADVPLDLPEVLPAAGVGARSAVALMARAGLEHVSRLDHPGFLAHMDPPTPWMTWAASMWASAMNQNLLHPDTAPAARQLESLVVGWLAPFFGMRAGHMTAGSTLANLTALWAARDVAGARRVFCSTAAHLSIAKACRILGLELVQVPVDDQQRMRADLLPENLSDAVVVLTAGTVATGAVDPLHGGTGAAWRHVDAAWAGPLRFSERHRQLLDGIEAADSVSVSAHKWLYQPKDSALVLFGDPQPANEALSFGSGYLTLPNVGVLGSRGNAALPLAVTMLAWGARGIAARVEADMAVADQLAELIAADANLQLWQRPVAGVVNWRPRNLPPERVRDNLRGAWVSLTAIDSDTWFRSVVANPLADPATVVTAVTQAIAQQHQ